MEENLCKIIEKLKSCNSVAIFGHINTDGDCIGSMLALCNFLAAHGKRTDIFVDSKLPKEYATIPTFEAINSELFEEKNYDLFVAIDCSTPERLGIYKQAFLDFENTVLVDHHIRSARDYAKFCHVEENTSSCGEVLYKILKQLDKITPIVATCLYAAIIFDTNFLSNNNVSSSTFNIVGELIDLGADAQNINYYTQRLKTKKQIKLAAFMLNKVRIYNDVAVLVVKKRQMKRLGVKGSDVSKYLQYINDIEGVKITVLIKQKARREYCASLRSLAAYSANKVAENFGGGGHKNAAGCTYFGCICKFKKQILNASKSEIARVDNA